MNLGAILGLAAALYASLAALMFLFQDRLLFLPSMPSRTVAQTPAAAGLSFESVLLRTDDGETLAGWWIPAPDARRTLIHFHGNAGNIGDRVELLRVFNALPLNVLMFDYRGYGDSTGTPSEEGTYRDARTVWRYLTEQRGLKPADIVLHGQSLGGAVAAELAEAVQPGALILESTFTSVPELAAGLYPWLPVRWLARIRYDTRARLSAIRCPVLVIHSRDDEIIPYAHGERLHAAAAQPKRLLTIRGDHNNGVYANAGDYLNGLREFLNSVNSASD